MSALPVRPMIPPVNRSTSGKNILASLPRRVATAIRASPQTPYSGSCALTTSVIACTMSEALGEINQAVESGADIVELRIDFLRSFNAARDIRVLLDACPVPCIVTYRPAWEGGHKIRIPREPGHETFGTTRRNTSAPPGEILLQHQEKSFCSTRRNNSATPREILLALSLHCRWLGSRLWCSRERRALGIGGRVLRQFPDFSPRN